MKLLLSILLLCSSLNAQWVSGFYIANNGTLTVPNIPWSKYTQVIHFAARAGVNGSGVGNGSVNTSELTDTAALIASRPAGKKVLLCLSGNNSFPLAFAQDAAAGLRSTFVTNITSAVVSNGYDGVELDWEANVNTSDYIALIAALRAAMPAKTIAMDTGDFNGLQIVSNGAQANLDEINVMCYDMDGNGSNNSDCGGVNCSWFNDSVLSAGDVFKNTCQQRTGVITSAGVAPTKIGIGIPYYGRIWNGTTVPQTIGSFATATVLYRNLVADARFAPANQRYDAVHQGQYLSVGSSNQFISYTGTQQIGDIVTWAKSQNFGGWFTFTLDYEYLSSQTGDARYPLSTALYADVFATPCATDSNGWCVTGLSAKQDNLLGPLIPYGASPWPYGDAAEKGVADSMAPAALTYVPALGTALAGTVSWTQGTQVLNTTADLRSALAGQSYLVCAWDSVDGAGTGRLLAPVGTVTSSTIDVSGGGDIQEPSASGRTCYLLPPATTINGVDFDFQQWTTQNPNTVWPYYDVAIALYRLYYRTGNATYLTQARQYADINWQWTLDHGYRIVSPRASTMLSQFFRALEGHPERFPGLYTWIATEVPRWAPTSCPNCDPREVGYETLAIATGAKTDTDPTRHAQYCSWLSSFVTTWNGKQASDGSFPENTYSQNSSYVTAPKTYTGSPQFGAAPWREFVNATALESAYESLNDTTTQGCNNPTLAAATLPVITNLVTWLRNYGRDTTNRGIFYEINYQSQPQTHLSLTGTFNATLGSPTLSGSGTNWQSAGYCDGTHFIGIRDIGYTYKIASCSSNTSATLSVNFGYFGEVANVTGSAGDVAPAAYTGCASSATYCFGPTGNRDLTRSVAGATGWLYGKTLNTTYQGWTNEWLSATLGGPTAGLTPATNIGSFVLPCSGPACDGYVNDMVVAAPVCGSSPCVTGGVGPFSANTGKNYGEAFGAPGIDNALAWRLLVAPPPPVAPTITSSSPLPGGTTGTGYSFQFVASGTTPITWTGTGLPAWASLSSTGLLTGTPSAAATTALAITATNLAGSAGPTTFSLTVVSSGTPPTITSASPLPNGTLGTAYSFQFAANGTTPITWTATGLPVWASLSSSGLLTGNPSVIGTSTISVTAANAIGTNPKNFSLTIVGIAPTITSISPLPGGTNGTPYSFQFTASGTAPITWTAAGLPGWASLSTGGLLTGTPNANGTTTIAITALNASGTSGPHNFNITVIAGSVAPTITSSSPLPNATFGSPYSFQFAALGTAPIIWSGTGLPAWASLSGGGLLTGTPNAIAVSTLHITATNGTGSDGPTTFSLTVPGVAPSITTASPLPGGTVGIPYSRQFAATGTTPITWSATGLPGWASLSATGLLSGTPNAAAVSSFPVTATNATGSDGPDTFALTIVAGATAPTITSTSPLPSGTTLTPYSYQFTANGTAPITWSASGLPGWATLSSGGLLAGLPNAAATSTIQATATNSGGSAGPTAFSLTIASAPPPPATCSPRTGNTPPSATDIQYQTNMALALTACTNSLTGSGCTVVDVQRVINASLGGTCVVGP